MQLLFLPPFVVYRVSVCRVCKQSADSPSVLSVPHLYCVYPLRVQSRIIGSTRTSSAHPPPLGRSRPVRPRLHNASGDAAHPSSSPFSNPFLSYRHSLSPDAPIFQHSLGSGAAGIEIQLPCPPEAVIILGPSLAVIVMRATIRLV